MPQKKKVKRGSNGQFASKAPEVSQDAITTAEPLTTTPDPLEALKERYRLMHEEHRAREKLMRQEFAARREFEKAHKPNNPL